MPLLPPLAAEDHVCDECGISYPLVSVAAALDIIADSPNQLRTARWLVRQAAHEGRHHISDIAAIGSALTGKPE